MATLGGTQLRHGQRWEFHNRTRETVSVYEICDLPEFKPTSRFDRVVHLRNLETGGVAKIYTKWLREGESRKPLSYWRLAA